MRLLDMAGLRMHVLPVAIDWNADIQLPVGLFGVGLEGAAVCFDDGPVAVEAAAQAESHVGGCGGVAGGDVDGVRVEGDADGVPFAPVGVFGDVRVQFRRQARQQSHGLRRERPVWFGEQVVAGESRGFEPGLLLVDQRLQTGTLRGDAGFCGHGPAAALKSPSAGSKQDVNPLFAQQFVMAAGSHEHGGTIIANP